jgi:hypothetical protein
VRVAPGVSMTSQPHAKFARLEPGKDERLLVKKMEFDGNECTSSDDPESSVAVARLKRPTE